MAKARFPVTYEIVTPESAAEGDADERGYIEDGARLRDALEAFRQTRTCQVDGIQSIEPDSHPCERPRWFTVNNGPEFDTGARESRSLHIPETVTRASARRIARLAGVHL
jgi:hypothetical protein